MLIARARVCLAPSWIALCVVQWHRVGRCGWYVAVFGQFGANKARFGIKIAIVDIGNQ